MPVVRADLRKRAVLLVVEHEVLHGVVGDDEVEPAIGVEIDGGDARATSPSARRSPDS